MTVKMLKNKSIGIHVFSFEKHKNWTTLYTGSKCLGDFRNKKEAILYAKRWNKVR